LLAFKADYKVLFECLHCVFGLMIPNSRLCKQIHGMMRHGLCSGTGMDEGDAQQSYATSTDYDMKQERRQMIHDSSLEPPSKRTRRSLSNKN
jgi:hypothetical protein